MPRDNSVLSETISFLRFPLIVLVVFAHVDFGFDPARLADFPAAQFVCQGLVQWGISKLPVRLFFFMAGFLFFKNADWCFALYKRKIRSRIFTIVIPFLVWSLLAIAYVELNRRVLSPVPPYEGNLFLLRLTDIFCTAHNEYLWFPIIYPFWFIRDLFVVCLLSPIWHFCMKNETVGKIFVFAVGVVWFTYSGLQPPGLNPAAIFFFCAGGYFSIHGRDFTADFAKIGTPVTIAFPILLLADALTQGSAANWWIHQTFILVGVVALVFWASLGVAAGKFRASALLSGSVFMVYAGHTVGFFADPFNWAINSIYLPECNFGIIAMFFLKVALEVLIWVGIYYCLRRWVPKSLKLLTGAR